MKHFKKMTAAILVINIGIPFLFAAAEDATPAAKEMERSKEIERLRQEMERINSLNQQRQKHKYISNRTLANEPTDYQYYIQAFTKKMERIGTINYPAVALEMQHPAKVLVDVGINADGTLQKIRILQSSGDARLDDSVITLVRMAAPFAPFPESIKRETDILHITRMWSFIPNSKADSRKAPQETTVVK